MRDDVIYAADVAHAGRRRPHPTIADIYGDASSG
jgi:hypothetical protein